MNNKKIREKIMNRQYQNIGYDDACRFVQSLGFQFERQHGTSHRQYRHSKNGEKLNIQRDKSGDAKPYQMRQVRDIIIKYGL